MQTIEQEEEYIFFVEEIIKIGYSETKFMNRRIKPIQNSLLEKIEFWKFYS